MIKEHDRIALRTNIPAEKLKSGDIGTVVHVYKKCAPFEVEFLTLHGETLTVTSLEASQVRPLQKREIAHARLLKAT
jgi:hypothetical protein